MASSQPPTHYDTLNLTPSILNDSSDPSSLIKKAYHRALLQNHPDKSTSSTLSSSSTQCRQIYTVDQITTAFTVLSSPRQRPEYDAQLRQAQALSRSSGSGSGPKFQTGVENVDLDDLPFDDGKERWYRSCRCGNKRGYLFGEEDLIEVEDDGVLMVGCQDCSLWLRVHFAVVDDDTPLDEDKTSKS